MISENYEISGLKSESSQEKENIFRSAVFKQKNTFFSSLFLKKAQSKSDCLYLTTNQEMSVGPWLRPTGRTHQKLSNEPRYRSPFIGDLTRGTF